MALLAAIGTAACAAHVEAEQSHPQSQARAPKHVVAIRAAAEQPANMTGTAFDLDRPSGRAVLSAFEIPGDGSNGAAGTMQPGIGLWDERSQHVDADRQINLPPSGNFTTATSNAGHDAPAIALTSDDGVLVAYGAASTYASYHPPAAWSCLRAQYCEPFKFAPSDDASASLADDLARSQEYLLPASGLSEMSSATLGDATLLAGQQQTATRSGQAGAQGFVSYRRGGIFDTAAGAWNFRAQHAPAGDGLYTISRAPNDDAYVEFVITAVSGAGTIALALPGGDCVLHNVPAASPSSAVAAFVQYANTQCTAFRGRYRAVAVPFAPLERSLGTAVIGIAYRAGDVMSLPPAPSDGLTCSGGIACASPRGANMLYDVRLSGLHRHFMFGGVRRLGRFIYDLVDVQQVTGSWFGAEHNSFALALACFRTDGPHGSAWEWTDCSGRHPFSLTPGAAPVARLERGSPYLIPPPSSYPSEFTPYIYDWSMSAQPPASPTTYPVVSAESLALLRDGTLVIAHGCQTRAKAFGLCYALYDTKTGRTTSVGFIDDAPRGGSLASIALRTDGRGGLALGAIAGIGSKWGCTSPGPCALVYSFDGVAKRWSRVSAQSLEGANDAGFVGTVAVSAHGFLYQYKQRSGNHATIVSFEGPAP